MELKWVNKHLALYYELDGDGVPGKPIWLPPDDPRLAGSGFLELVGEYGDDPGKNTLVRGDNLLALETLAAEYRDDPPVKCAYLDPPYNTSNAFERYDDNFEHSEWLGLMHRRLVLVRDMLRLDGVACVQIDDNEHAYLELLLDEVFGSGNKLGTIVWRRRQSQANLARLSTIHDYVLVYARDRGALPAGDAALLGSALWTDTDKYGYNQLASKEVEAIFHSKKAFDTPKPELLVYNILDVATEPGDVVLDCFLGSGTTASVAHKMGRRWIGVEMGPHAESLCLERLRMVVRPRGEPEGVGVTGVTGWRGGGGFRFYRVRRGRQSAGGGPGRGRGASTTGAGAWGEDTRGESALEVPGGCGSDPRGPGPRSSPFRGTLGLYWEGKDGDLELVLGEGGDVTCCKWLPRPDHSTREVRSIDRHPALGRELGVDGGVEFSPGALETGSHLVTGPPVEALRAVAASVVQLPDFQRVQCAFFRPPHSWQDPASGALSREEFLTTVQTYLRETRKCLRSSGVIVAHLEEGNYAGVKVVHDEVFGRDNYIATIVWGGPSGEGREHGAFDYLLLYAKDGGKARLNKLPPTDEHYSNPDGDPRGKWESRPLVASEKSSNREYTYTFKNGASITRKWRYTRENLRQFEEEGRVYFTKPSTGEGIPRLKVFFEDRLATYNETGMNGKTPNSLWVDPTEFGSRELLYSRLLEVCSRRGDLVMDCFSRDPVVLVEAGRLHRRWIGLTAGGNPTKWGEAGLFDAKGGAPGAPGARAWVLNRSIFRGGELDFRLPRDKLARGVLACLGYSTRGSLEVSSGRAGPGTLTVHLGRARGALGVALLADPPHLVSRSQLREILKCIRQAGALPSGLRVRILTNCGVQVPRGAGVEVVKVPYALLPRRDRRFGSARLGVGR
ncbi:MAG: DNA methyltransferase [Promethearchaeota archaeon]